MHKKFCDRFNNSAFTLMELLSILVIISLIAIVTLPVVFNIINNASRGAAIDSASNYALEVYKSFLKLLENDPNYEIPTGTFFVSGNVGIIGGDPITTIDVSVSGKLPDYESDSWIELGNDEVVAYSLKIGDYIITKQSDGSILTSKSAKVEDNETVLYIKSINQTGEEKAEEIKNNLSLENGINDDSDGWIAILNDKVIGYSLKIVVDDKNYVVTKNDNDISLEEGTTLNTKVRSICENKVIDYYKGIATSKLNDIVADITGEEVVSLMLDKAQSDNSNISIKLSEISGLTVPSNIDGNSWMYYNYVKRENKVVITDYSISIIEGNYTFVVNMEDGVVGQTVSGNLRKQKNIEPLIVYTSADGVSYYDTVWVADHPVYYNPITAKICNIDNINGFYHTDNSIVNYNGVDTYNGSNTSNNNGCLKWYRYSEFTDNRITRINMLLDHELVRANWYGYYDNSAGPVVALSALSNRTSAWSNKLLRNDTYTAKWNNGNADRTFTIDYSDYKARLITAQEIAFIARYYDWNENTSSGTLNLPADISSWIYNTYFWTSTPISGSENRAFYIHGLGHIGTAQANSDRGIRPVITILKP